MDPNKSGLSNQTLTLHLKKKEQQEIRTFLSFIAKNNRDISMLDNSELSKHPVFEKMMSLETTGDKANSHTALQDPPDTITFNEQWFEHFGQMLPADSGTSDTDIELKRLYEYGHKMRDAYTSKIVRFFQNDPNKIVAAIKGMNRFIDINKWILFETYLRRKQREIDDQKHKNEQLSKEFEEFAHVASHDLQQPLTTLISISALLEDEFPEILEGDCGVYIQYMRKASDRMSSMVYDLLDHSRIGRWSQKQKVDLNKVVDYVLNDMKTDLRKAQAKIEITDLPMVSAYPVEMKFLFRHLVDNAIKFHEPDSSPLVSISSKKSDGYWIISVTDNGIGIDSKHFEKVFVMFQKLHNLEKYGGNGCGLAHCKKVVKLHDGKIWLDSTPGNGTIVSFTIPAVD